MKSSPSWTLTKVCSLMLILLSGFDEQKQNQARKNQRMKMHLKSFLAIVIPNSPWVTKATVHTSFAGTTLECSITPLIIQSSITRQ